MMEDLIVSQKNLSLTITTPLGKDVLIVDSLTGFEQISAPFEFHLKLHSKNSAINMQSLIGKEVTVTFLEDKAKRYFSGIVGEIFQEQTAAKTDPFNTRYQMKIYPTLWLLKFNSDHRIFQNKSAIEIIKKIFTINKLTNYQNKTTKHGTTVREYCVQYGESAFDFVSRLMEQEGIFYFFKHESSGHQLVLADASSAFAKSPTDKIGVINSLEGAPLFNKILFCSLHNQVVASSFTSRDYNFTTATTPMLSTVSGKGAGGEIYSYPGLFSKTSEGDALSTLRIQALEWNKTTFQGTSTAAELTAGYKFAVTDHLLPSINTTYVAYRVHHSINQNGRPPDVYEQSDKDILPLYENSFVAFDAKIVFSPPIVTPKPRIYSTQTAVVTGKSGEEIWTDKYGRVTVQFYWDRLGKKDEKSSCMIRVAQTWAMSGWGSLFTPRIGQEVVVTFLDGDPDRPLITGCVYNCDHMPPYLPATPTKSTILSNTSKGGKGSNEIRFEDLKDSEEVYVHAQKDMNRVVENNDTLTIHQGSRTIMIASKGKEVPHHSLTVVKGDDIIHLQEGNLTITLDKGDESHKITGNVKFKATGNITLKAAGDIKIEADGKVSIKSGADMTTNAGATMSMKSATSFSVKSGTSLSVKAGTDLSMKAAAAVSIKGVAMTIKGSASGMIDGGPMLQLKSAAMVQVQGGAAVKLTGAMIALSGMVKIG
ncbi:MAG: type VI secretion system tip protein TssI/VgrG [Alphaproteobacteria bacterium]